MEYTPKLVADLFMKAGAQAWEIRDNEVEFRVSKTEFMSILFNSDFTLMELRYWYLQSADENDPTGCSQEKSKADNLINDFNSLKKGYINGMEYDIRVLKAAYFDASFSRTFKNAIIIEGEETDNILYLFYDRKEGFIRDIRLIPVVKLIEDMSMFSGESVVDGEDYIEYECYGGETDENCSDEFSPGLDL